MRVLQVNDFPLAGGAELMVEETVRLLRESGHEAQVFTADSAGPHRVTPRRYIDCSICRRALRQKLDVFTPDVVHLHNFYHALSPGILEALQQWRDGYAAQARIVMTAHDFHLICPNPSWRRRSRGKWVSAAPANEMRTLSLLLADWDHRGRHYSVLRALQHLWNYRWHDRRRVIDLVLCPSRFMTAAIEKAGLPARFLPNPVRTVTTTPNKPDGSLRLIFAGRIEPEKGVEPFIRGLPPSFTGTLDVVGDGSAVAACRAAAQRSRHADRIAFTGRLDREEALARIAQSHALVLPSLCIENAPNVLFEALAVRTNLLVADHSGMREIVDASGIGFRFDSTDTAALAAQLRAMEKSLRDGTLNAFDPQPFLADRSELAHADALLAAYTDSHVAPPTSASGSARAVMSPHATRNAAS